MKPEQETPEQIARRIINRWKISCWFITADQWESLWATITATIQSERLRAEEAEKRELAEAESLLRKLHSESMASDFNEHWESFTKAQQWLERRRNIK